MAFFVKARYTRMAVSYLLGLSLFIVVCFRFSEKNFFDDGFTRVVNSNSDPEAYYGYLPATFITGDICHMPFAALLPNGNRLNKVTYGVALMESPFFLVANALHVPDNSLPGMADIYGRALVVSGLFYVFSGLFLLYFLLRRKFSRNITMLTLLLLFIATNLYYYSLIQISMSHPYSFFCCACVMFFTERYYRRKLVSAGIIALTFACLATLIRPTNIVFILFFVLFEVYSLPQLKERIVHLIRQWKVPLISALIGSLIAVPQLYYWHLVSGSFLTFSYGNESFLYLTQPKILQVLGGHRNGWLLFSPVMILSLAGLLLCWKRKVMSAPATLLCFLLTLYLCASWWAYDFGCGFGYRPFIDYYPMLAFPMAFSLQLLFRKRVLVKVAAVLFVVACTYWNMKLSRIQASSGLCWAHESWTPENQWEMFGKITKPHYDIFR